MTHFPNCLCDTFFFLPHFDVICDQLLNRSTATWNLFAKNICIIEAIPILLLHLNLTIPILLLHLNLKPPNCKLLCFSFPSFSDLVPHAVLDGNQPLFYMGKHSLLLCLLLCLLLRICVQSLSSRTLLRHAVRGVWKWNLLALYVTCVGCMHYSSIIVLLHSKWTLPVNEWHCKTERGTHETEHKSIDHGIQTAVDSKAEFQTIELCVRPSRRVR